MGGEEEDKRDSNPSSSHPSILASSTDYQSTALKTSPDDVLDYLGFGPFQACAAVRESTAIDLFVYTTCLSLPALSL